MVNQVAGPRCLVEIFPQEGGVFSISSEGTPARILSCVVQKDIRLTAGNFEIILAPGGPSGVDGPPTWIDVLTCMSTVKIGMQRGTRTGVVMVGVITEVTESTSFEEDRVIRTTIVVGKDIGYFWENYSFFTLSAKGIVAPGTDPGIAGALGKGVTELFNYYNIDPDLADGLLHGNPAQIADNWYNGIMVALLSNTKLFIAADNSISFADAVTESIEDFPDFEIPYGLNFIESEFTFDQKMKSILEFPQYEVWYGTLPSDYPLADGTISDGFDFEMPNLDAKSKAVFMGRVNPIPVLKGGLAEIDTEKWDALPFSNADSSFINCNMRFSAGEVSNFYLLQSMAVRQLFGKDNGSSIAMYAYSDLAYDQDSLQRFGYRPHWHQTNWLNDPQGLSAKENADAFVDLLNDLIARIVSWYHPLPMMAHAEVVYTLLPNVFVGTKFQFSPKKYSRNDSSDLWTFYVKSVTHSFRFNGPSTTTLGLERGLPNDVYESPGMLLAVYTGTASRVDGIYQFADQTGAIVVPALSDAMFDFVQKREVLFPKPQSHIGDE